MSIETEGKYEIHGEQLLQIYNEMESIPRTGTHRIIKLNKDSTHFIIKMYEISGKHDQFLDNEIEFLEKLDHSINENNYHYANMRDAVLEDYNTQKSVDQNGSVEKGTEGGSSSGTYYDVPDAGNYSSENISPEIEDSNYSTNSPTTATNTTSNSDFVRTAFNSPDMQSSIANPISSSAGAAAAGVTGGVATAAGSAIANGISSINSKTGSVSVLEHNDYLLGNYDCSNVSNLLNEEQTKKVVDLLKEYGFSDDEINSILSGDYTVSQILVDSVSEKLNGLIETNPDIRQAIIDKYGIDVFNEDGSVNNDRLSLVLCIDDLDGKDEYSMINMLSKNYGINLVDPIRLSNYSKKIEELLLSDFSIKEKIKKEYGFDIFNSDGTINTDKLTLIMLIDSKRTDGRRIDSIIGNTTVSNTEYDLANSIKEIGIKSTYGSNPNVTKSVGIALAAAGATAATGMGIKKSLDKKKDKSNNAEHESVVKSFDTEINNDISDNDDDENDNSWLYDVINE